MTPSDRPASISREERVALKPCPFGCKGAPTSRWNEFSMDSGGYWSIECPLLSHANVMADDEDSAVREWNARALSPDERLIEALRKIEARRPVVLPRTPGAMLADEMAEIASAALSTTKADQ